MFEKHFAARLSKIAFVNIGKRILDFGEPGEDGHNWGISLGFPGIISVDRTFGDAGKHRPMFGMGLTGPFVGMSVGNKDRSVAKDPKKPKNTGDNQ